MTSDLGVHRCPLCLLVFPSQVTLDRHNDEDQDRAEVEVKCRPRFVIVRKVTAEVKAKVTREEDSEAWRLHWGHHHLGDNPSESGSRVSLRSRAKVAISRGRVLTGSNDD